MFGAIWYLYQVLWDTFIFTTFYSLWINVSLWSLFFLASQSLSGNQFRRMVWPKNNNLCQKRIHLLILKNWHIWKMLLFIILEDPLFSVALIKLGAEINSISSCTFSWKTKSQYYSCLHSWYLWYYLEIYSNLLKES